jgi:hypothetical protein
MEGVVRCEWKYEMWGGKVNMVVGLWLVWEGDNGVCEGWLLG